MSFRGLEAPILFGDFGLIGPDALGSAPPQALIRAENVAYETAELIPSLGSSKVNPTPLAGGAVVALLDWWPTSVIQRTIAVLENGSIFRDDGSGTFPVTMKTGLTLGVPVWAEGGGELLSSPRKAFLTVASGKAQVVEGDAATLRDIGPLAATEWTGQNQPRRFFPHAARMWALLKDRAYFSATDDHEDFQTAADGAGSLVIGVGVGERLEAGIPFKELLFLFKWPAGIFMVDTSPAAIASWAPTELTRMTGIAGPAALAVGGDEVLFVAETGHLHLLSNVKGNDVLASDLTVANRLAEWTKEHVDADHDMLQRSHVVYYATRREFHVSLPALTSLGAMVRLVVDLKRTGVPRVYIESKDICRTLALQRADPRGSTRTHHLIAGDDAGTVWRIDEEARSKNGQPYTCVFQTPHDDFSWLNERYRSRRKNLAFLEYLGSQTGAFEVVCRTFLDGVYKETIHFPLGRAAGGSQLDAFVLDTSVLAGELPLALRKRIRGSCRRLSLECTFIAQNSEFRCSGLIVSFTESGHRPVTA